MSPFRGWISEDDDPTVMRVLSSHEHTVARNLWWRNLSSHKHTEDPAPQAQPSPELLSSPVPGAPGSRAFFAR